MLKRILFALAFVCAAYAAPVAAQQYYFPPSPCYPEEEQCFPPPGGSYYFVEWRSECTQWGYGSNGWDWYVIPVEGMEIFIDEDEALDYAAALQANPPSPCNEWFGSVYFNIYSL